MRLSAKLTITAVLLLVLTLFVATSVRAQTCSGDDCLVQTVSSPPTTLNMLPGEQAEIVWRLRNGGGKPWGQDTRLVHVAGRFVVEPAAVNAPDTDPGAEAEFAATITAPQAPGSYSGLWQMKQAKDGFFGPVLTLELLVAQPEGSVTRAVAKLESGAGSAKPTDMVANLASCETQPAAGAVLFDESDCGGEQLALENTGVYTLADDGFDGRTASMLVAEGWSVLVTDSAGGDGDSLCVNGTVVNLDDVTYSGGDSIVGATVAQLEVFDRPDCEEAPLSGCAAVAYGGVILYDDFDCREQAMFIAAEGAYRLVDYSFRNKASSIYVAPGWSALVTQDAAGSSAGLCVSVTQADLGAVTFPDTETSVADQTSFIKVFPNQSCEAQKPIPTTPSGFVLPVNYPNLIWSVNTSMTAYEIEMDVDADYASPVQNGIVADGRYEVTGLPDETYYWRVRGQDREGVWSDWTESRTVVVDTVAPAIPGQLSPGDGDFVAEASPDLSWAAVEGVDLYHVQVDDDADFSSPEVKNISGAIGYTPPPLKSGAYFWRIRVRDVAGNWSEWSEPILFFVETSGDAGPVDIFDLYSDAALPVVNTNSNLRSGPGVEYPVVGQIDAGVELIVLGTDTGGEWCWLLDNSWIACSLVDNVPDGLPVVEAP